MTSEKESFTLPELQEDLSRLWINIKEREHKELMFNRNIKTLSSLNTVCIIVLAIMVITLIAVNVKELQHDHHSP